MNISINKSTECVSHYYQFYSLLNGEDDFKDYLIKNEDLDLSSSGINGLLEYIEDINLIKYIAEEVNGKIVNCLSFVHTLFYNYIV